MNIAGKKVIITGGTRGLGRQFAMDLKSMGASPYVVSLRQENLDAIRREANIPGTVVDASDENQVETFVDNYTREYGPPDVLINNAGITADCLFIKKRGDEITKFSYANWQRVINVNLTGVFLFSRDVAYQMVKHGIKGVIINISSVTHCGNVGQVNYSASKAGVNALTVTLAKELSKFGIRVAAIAPGFINTEMLASIREDMMARILQTIPMGRLGERDEISHAVKFIIQNEFFTGRVLEVDGGMRI